MAPIQNKSSSSSSSYSYNKSTSSHESTPRRDQDMSSRESSWESSFLPITRRGRFFQDSIFENTRSNFDDAVRDALHRWGDDSDFLTDTWQETVSPRMSNLTRYRQMRSRSIDEENLAVTVTSDNNNHKIVLDVHDFKDGELKVKVVGERELLVEGSKEKKSEGASAISSQKFSRRFALPQEVDVGAIDSVMSSDGILTITAPKMGRACNSTSHHEISSSSKSQRVREPCACDKCYPKLKTRENICTTNAERSQSVENDFYKEGTKERSEQRDSKSHSSSVEANSRKSSDRMSMDVPIRAFFNSRPITRRGRFFDDSFFEDTRGSYRTAIEDILSKWGEKSANTDDLTSYRNLRTRDLREDNQAVKSIEDEFQHKFILDVHDFMKDGEINVKAVDDRELVVEGHVVQQEGGSKSTKRFSRRFLLPDDVHLESVSSVMSSDGVLTIIAPKKNAVKNMEAIHEMTSTSTLDNKSNTSRSNTESFGKTSENYMKTSAEAKSYKESCMKDTHNTPALNVDDPNIRETLTCSSVYDNEAVQEEGEEEEEATLHSSVSSKIFKAEESQQADVVAGAHKISIHIDAAEEDVNNDVRNTKETGMENKGDDQNYTIGENMEYSINIKCGTDKSGDNLDAAQKSVRARSAESMETDQRCARGRSMDDFDTSMRSVRERSMDSRESRSGSTRFDREFDMEDDIDDINFQESSKHTDVTEKKLRSILKKPENYYQDDEERNSRERSYQGEESGNVDRRTPNRDNKRTPVGTPLNPDAKRSLPISVRGHFSSDHYFNDFQESFKTAISDVLTKFHEKSDKTDDITAYRNLRLRDPKLENQAFHVQEDQGAHKVVLDVKDFINGEIEAAVYEEKELVIEGRAEKRTGTSITTLSFLRRFPLPENVDTDVISIIMSSDGVLTVVTPWKGRSGLSAIKNILSEDRSLFDRHSDFNKHWDNMDWDSSSSRRDSDDFSTSSLSSRIRSRLHQTENDFF